jgi:16S rRNA (cytidine1402-2'-O)-methyltransferase
MEKPSLFLIPVMLGETPVDQVIPTYNTRVISQLKYFIVENVRSARRFLKACNPEIEIDALTFYELNKHTDRNSISDYLLPMKKGESVGVISEAGCPAVADPGADVVAIAQQKGYKVVPLVGPSSILMAVMASGFNGQSFAFHGYLPIDQNERAKRIRLLEARSYSEDQTQLFIETPYRNHKMAADILLHCNPATKLCIAMNISCDDEYIVTRSVKEWKGKLPEMHKKPCVFLIYKGS